MMSFACPAGLATGSCEVKVIVKSMSVSERGCKLTCDFTKIKKVLTNTYLQHVDILIFTT
jgi:hypothetical protein